MVLSLGCSGGIRRVTPSSAAQDVPVLPLTVICNTQQEADDVSRVQDVLTAHEHLTDDDDLLNALLDSGEVHSVLRNHTKFYGVIVGNIPTGIYLHQYLMSHSFQIIY
jgi:hypothetical protein